MSAWSFSLTLPAFVWAVSFVSFCARIINHAVLLKEGENCPRRDKTGNLAIERAKDRWCVTRYCVSGLCSSERTMTRPVWQQLGVERSWPLFSPRACAEPTVHWSICWIHETLGMVMPGPGLGWPCTFSISTADPVIERAHYLLQSWPFKSDKIFTGWSAQQLTTILRPNSCLLSWEYTTLMANTLCKLLTKLPLLSAVVRTTKTASRKQVVGLLMNKVWQSHDANHCIRWKQPPQGRSQWKILSLWSIKISFNLIKNRLIKITWIRSHA